MMKRLILGAVTLTLMMCAIPFYAMAKRDSCDTLCKDEYHKINTNWDKLTDKQRDEIYTLCDEMDDIREDIIEKYVEYGVLSKDDAAALRQRVEEHGTRLREQRLMPLSYLMRCRPDKARPRSQEAVRQNNRRVYDSSPNVVELYKY